MCVLLVCMLCVGVLHTYLHMYTHDQQHTYALSIPVTGREPIPEKNFFLSNSPSVVGGTNTRKEFFPIPNFYLIFSRAGTNTRKEFFPIKLAEFRGAPAMAARDVY